MRLDVRPRQESSHFFSVKVTWPSIQSMPVRIHDARRLANLAGNRPQLLVRNSTHIGLNVQQLVR